MKGAYISPNYELSFVRRLNLRRLLSSTIYAGVAYGNGTPSRFKIGAFAGSSPVIGTIFNLNQLSFLPKKVND